MADPDHIVIPYHGPIQSFAFAFTFTNSNSIVLDHLHSVDQIYIDVEHAAAIARDGHPTCYHNPQLN